MGFHGAALGSYGAVMGQSADPLRSDGAAIGCYAFAMWSHKLAAAFDGIAIGPYAAAMGQPSHHIGSHKAAM